MDIAYQDVTCENCGKEYTCTPEEDYYHLAGFKGEKTTDNGLCWDCFMEATNMPPQAEPPYEERIPNAKDKE
jgi:hypothetical protein